MSSHAAAPKKTTSVSMAEPLLAEAKALGINVSQVAVLPVVVRRLTILPDLGPSAPSSSSPSHRVAAKRAALTELQRRLEARAEITDYLRD